MSDKIPESRPSASGVLEALGQAFKWGKSEPVKTVAAAQAPALVEEIVVPAPVTPAEEASPDWLTPPVVEEQVDRVVLKESSADTVVHPAAAQTVIGLKLAEPSVVEEPGIPDWLKVPHPLAEDSKQKTLGPDDFLPKEKAEASPVVIISKSEEEKAEVDPFAGIKEFNGQMELIRQAQQLLTSAGILSSEGARQALLAVAKANSLLPKLPEDLLKSVILMKAVASNNPKYGREDFQREMLAVVDQVRGGTIKKA